MSTELHLQTLEGVVARGALAAAQSRAEDLGRGRGWLRRFWKSQTRQNAEDELLYRGSSFRKPWLPALLLTPLLCVLGFMLLREPDNTMAAGMLLFLAIALAYGLLSAWLERSMNLVFWPELMNVAVYALLISAVLGTILIVEHPRTHIYSIVFVLYFLLIGATGLSNDPRIPVVAGAFSILGFVGAVSVLDVAAAAGNGFAMKMSGQFEPIVNAARIVFLMGATFVAAASARRGLELRRSGIRDPLTSLMNRRAFDWYLERQVERARELGRPLSLAMVDIDHFKKLNDEYGHAAGDAVLAWVSARLPECVRATDCVARYGGEEFVVAFIDSDHEALEHRLDSWRHQIDGSEIAVDGHSIHVTVSIGIARLPGDAEDAEAVLRCADQRLYRAKAEGRNRMVAS